MPEEDSFLSDLAAFHQYTIHVSSIRDRLRDIIKNPHNYNGVEMAETMLHAAQILDQDVHAAQALAAAQPEHLDGMHKLADRLAQQ